jgi:hypothetical protein
LRSHGPSSSRSSCSAAPAALLTCLLRDKRERRRPSCAAFCLGRRRRQSSARFMDLAARQRVSYQRAQGRYPRRPTEARKRSSAKKSRSPLGLVAPNRGSPIVPMTNASCPFEVAADRVWPLSTEQHDWSGGSSPLASGRHRCGYGLEPGEGHKVHGPKFASTRAALLDQSEEPIQDRLAEGVAWRHSSKTDRTDPPPSRPCRRGATSPSGCCS